MVIKEVAVQIAFFLELLGIAGFGLPIPGGWILAPVLVWSRSMGHRPLVCAGLVCVMSAIVDTILARSAGVAAITAIGALTIDGPPATSRRIMLVVSLAWGAMFGLMGPGTSRFLGEASETLSGLGGVKFGPTGTSLYVALALAATAVGLVPLADRRWRSVAALLGGLVAAAIIVVGSTLFLQHTTLHAYLAVRTVGLTATAVAMGVLCGATLLVGRKHVAA